MSNRIAQKGFGIVEGVLIVAILVIVGGVGWVAYNNFASPKSTSSDASKMTSHDDMKMPKIEKPADLDKASESLDDKSFEDDGADELDKKSADF